MNKVLYAGLLMTVSLIGLTACEPMMIDGCDSTDTIKTYCGFEKPEDLEPLGNTPWILVSVLGNFQRADTEGGVFAINLESEETFRLIANVSPDPSTEQCGGAPDRLRPRGFHVSDLADGGYRLLVVNAAGDQRIERYRIDFLDNRPSMTWQGCVRVPDSLLANDVAATVGDGLVVSHMYEPPRTGWMTVKFMLGLHTGYAVAWDAERGWRIVPGTDASIANGIEYDPKAGKVFVASTYGETLSIADLDGKEAKTIRIPVQSDNVTWSDDGRLIAVGHTGIPLIGTSACRNAPGQTCSFPFAAVAIDPVTLRQEIIYAHSDGLIPGASVALVKDGYIYFGTVFGDRVSRVGMPPVDG